MMDVHIGIFILCLCLFSCFLFNEWIISFDYVVCLLRYIVCAGLLWFLVHVQVCDVSGRWSKNQVICNKLAKRNINSIGKRKAAQKAENMFVTTTKKTQHDKNERQIQIVVRSANIHNEPHLMQQQQNLQRKRNEQTRKHTKKITSQRENKMRHERSQENKNNKNSNNDNLSETKEAKKKEKNDREKRDCYRCNQINKEHYQESEIFMKCPGCKEKFCEICSKGCFPFKSIRCFSCKDKGKDSNNRCRFDTFIKIKIGKEKKNERCKDNEKNEERKKHEKDEKQNGNKEEKYHDDNEKSKMNQDNKKNKKNNNESKNKTNVSPKITEKTGNGKFLNEIEMWWKCEMKDAEREVDTIMIEREKLNDFIDKLNCKLRLKTVKYVYSHHGKQKLLNCFKKLYIQHVGLKMFGSRNLMYGQYGKCHACASWTQRDAFVCYDCYYENENIICQVLDNVDWQCVNDGPRMMDNMNRFFRRLNKMLKQIQSLGDEGYKGDKGAASRTNTKKHEKQKEKEKQKVQQSKLQPKAKKNKIQNTQCAFIPLRTLIDYWRRLEMQQLSMNCDNNWGRDSINNMTGQTEHFHGSRICCSCKNVWIFSEYLVCSDCYYKHRDIIHEIHKKGKERNVFLNENDFFNYLQNMFSKIVTHRYDSPDEKRRRRKAAIKRGRKQLKLNKKRRCRRCHNKRRCRRYLFYCSDCGDRETKEYGERMKKIKRRENDSDHDHDDHENTDKNRNEEVSIPDDETETETEMKEENKCYFGEDCVRMINGVFDGNGVKYWQCGWGNIAENLNKQNRCECTICGECFNAHFVELCPMNKEFQENGCESLVQCFKQLKTTENENNYNQDEYVTENNKKQDKKSCEVKRKEYKRDGTSEAMVESKCDFGISNECERVNKKDGTFDSNGVFYFKCQAKKCWGRVCDKCYIEHGFSNCENWGCNQKIKDYGREHTATVADNAYKHEMTTLQADGGKLVMYSNTADNGTGNGRCDFGIDCRRIDADGIYDDNGTVYYQCSEPDYCGGVICDKCYQIYCETEQECPQDCGELAKDYKQNTNITYRCN